MDNSRVYVPVASPAHQWLQCVDEDDRRALNAVGSRHSSSSLPPLRVRLIKENDHKLPLKGSGLLWLGSHVLAMTTGVKDRLEPLLSDQGRFSELISEDGEFWMFVPHIRDLLEESRSELVRFASGRVMHVVRYAFTDCDLADVIAFRIPQVPTGPLFCTQRLVDAVEGEGGVGFQQVWPAPGP